MPSSHSACSPLPPAQAQQPTGHYWKITYADSPDSSWSYDNINGSYGAFWSLGSNGQGCGGGGDWNGRTSGTVTTTLTWVPAAFHTLASDPPSEPVHIQEIGRAWEQSLWGGPAIPHGYGGTADDGLGDTAVNGLSTGTHLFQADGSSGTITLRPVTMSAINPTRTWQLYPGQPPGGYGYYDWPQGECTLSLDVQVIADPRAVTISSAIETSYYKGNSQQGTPNQWIHQRDWITGAMAVDSAVVWQDATGVNARGWQINSLPLTATSLHFLGYPRYSWSLVGLTLPEAWLTYPSNNPTNFSLLEPDGIKFPLHGTVVVRATDSDGFIATNIYDMTLHLPLEKVVVVSFTQNVPILVGSLQPIDKNTTVPVTLQIPGREGEIDWGATQQQLGLPVAVTGTAAGGLLLIPEVAAGPGGWMVMTAQIIASGASYKLGTASPDHPGTVPIEGNADYNEYYADVQHQVTTNIDPNHAGDLVRFKPEALAAQASAMAQSLGAPTVYSGWSSDPYFMHSTAQWQGGWYTDLKSLLGDGYNAHGYAGDVLSSTKVPQVPFKYFLWTCTYIKPPTN